MKRILLAVLTALTLLGGTISSVFADDWCSDDPPVVIVTPQGHRVVVFVTDYALGTQHAPVLKRVTYSYVATPASDGSGTDVVLRVNIPGDSLAAAFPTRSVVANAMDDESNKYVVYSTQSGTSGLPIVHRFTLKKK
jgi:hypothetical protein